MKGRRKGKKMFAYRKEEERKQMTSESELEERRWEQERRHEMQMQSMMLGFLQQMSHSNPNPSLYGSSSHPLPFPTNYHMPPHDPDDYN